MSDFRHLEFLPDGLRDILASVFPGGMQVEYSYHYRRFLLVRQEVSVNALESEWGSATDVAPGLQFLTEPQFYTKAQLLRVENRPVLHVSDEIASEVAVEHRFGYGHRFHTFLLQRLFEGQEIIQVTADTVELEDDDTFPILALLDLAKHFGEYGAGSFVRTVLFRENTVDNQPVLTGILLYLVDLRGDTEIPLCLFIGRYSYVSDISNSFGTHSMSAMNWRK